MASRFASVTEEEICLIALINEAVVPENTKKETKIRLTMFAGMFVFFFYYKNAKKF